MHLDARSALWAARGRRGSAKTAKTFVTCDSRVVPHRSTEQAQGCLTSEFGWDPVFSPWYERMMRMNRRPGIPTVQGQCAGGGARGAQCPPFGPDLRRFCVRLVVETRAFCMGMPHARLEGGRRGSKVPPCPISFACGDFEPFVFAPFYSKTVEIQTCRGIADSQSPPPPAPKEPTCEPRSIHGPRGSPRLLRSHWFRLFRMCVKTPQHPSIEKF